MNDAAAKPIPFPSEETIHALVHGFYAQVRRDPQLAPIFERAITGDWEPHLARMCDFWSGVVRQSGRYTGNPMLAHMKQKTIRPEHFARWLELFGKSAREICSADEAELFIARAENIARSLQLGMFYRHGITPGKT
jgi:hemoglobin